LFLIWTILRGPHVIAWAHSRQLNQSMLSFCSLFHSASILLTLSRSFLFSSDHFWWILFAFSLHFSFSLRSYSSLSIPLSLSLHFSITLSPSYSISLLTISLYYSYFILLLSLYPSFLSVFSPSFSFSEYFWLQRPENREGVFITYSIIISLSF